MMKKNSIKVVLIFLFSFYIAQFDNLFLYDISIIFPTFLSLIGLCLTVYIFIIPHLLSLNLDSDRFKNHFERIVKEFEDNTKGIFYLLMLLIFVYIIKYIDFPFISNCYDLDLKLLYIFNLKFYIVNVTQNFLFFLSLLSFWDILIASFTIIKVNKC